MKLYELTQDFKELQDLLEDESIEKDEDAIINFLKNISENIDIKIDNIASLVKSKIALIKAIKEQEIELKKRREREEKQADTLKEYLSNEMQNINKLKFENEKHKITFRKSSIIEIDEFEFPKELKIKETVIKIPSKTEIKEMLQSREIDGVTVIEKQNIQIK